jgi:hypothetical protein
MRIEIARIPAANTSCGPNTMSRRRRYRAILELGYIDAFRFLHIEVVEAARGSRVIVVGLSASESYE